MALSFSKAEDLTLTFTDFKFSVLSEVLDSAVEGGFVQFWNSNEFSNESP